MSKEETPQKQLDKSFSLTQGERAREWGAAPPPDEKKPVDPSSPKCAACGRYHGGINTHFNCLRRGIAQRDQQIADLKAQMEGLRTRVRLERAGREGPAAQQEPEAVPVPPAVSPDAAAPSRTENGVAPESRADYLTRRGAGAQA